MSRFDRYLDNEVDLAVLEEENEYLKEKNSELEIELKHLKLRNKKLLARLKNLEEGNQDIESGASKTVSHV